MSSQHYYGHGKLLLTAEYLVLDGAKALALPCQLGQKLILTQRPSNTPKLYWKSFDSEGKNWFSATFELWHFDLIEGSGETALILQKILRQARKQNIHFLRDNCDTYAATELEFPVDWGLGSSSTLIYNIAQWAYISPFELLQNTFGGSGYDICCAQSMGPITYQLKASGPSWELISFNPSFKDNIYFVHLNKKRDSQEAVKEYRKLEIENKELYIKKMNKLTNEFIAAKSLESFENLIKEHEELIEKVLSKKTVKTLFFDDYWGQIKSLGAWGGDFVIATSRKSEKETLDYFTKKGFETVYHYSEIVLEEIDNFPSDLLTKNPVRDTLEQRI